MKRRDFHGCPQPRSGLRPGPNSKGWLTFTCQPRTRLPAGRKRDGPKRVRPSLTTVARPFCYVNGLCAKGRAVSRSAQKSPSTGSPMNRDLSTFIRRVGVRVTGGLLVLSPNPPKDTDGRREDSGRGWVRELQGRWPGVGVDGRPADGLQSPHRAPKALCGSCDARDGERDTQQGTLATGGGARLRGR